jgi:NodT family efflux transporter outer membrane factor (OMF) lipoprotein
MRSARSLVTLAAAIGVVTVGAAPVAAQSVSSQPEAARPVGSEAAGGFWRALGDPVLNRLIDQALSGSPELRAASARREGAGAARLGSALELGPVVRADAGFTRQRLASATFPGASPGGMPDQDLWTSGLTLAWELDFFGRLRGDLNARDHLVGAADEDVRSARVALAAQVARGYFDLRGAQRQLEVARGNASNQTRTLDVTRIRLEAGRGTELDTERALAQLAFTQAAIPALEARVASARHRIATLIGRPATAVAEELAAGAEPPELPESLPAADLEEVLRTRPDVVSARGRAAASRALVSSARADFLPRVSLAADAGYMAGSVDAFGNRGTFNYRFGPVVSWAALDLGRVKARVDQAEAVELEANARFEQAELRAREELEAADVWYRSARARLTHLRAAAAASERAARLAGLRYEGGIADFLQVLDAERTLLAAQDQLAQAETQAAEAYVTLFEARGGPVPAAR